MGLVGVGYPEELALKAIELTVPPSTLLGFKNVFSGSSAPDPTGGAYTTHQAL